MKAMIIIGLAMLLISFETRAQFDEIDEPHGESILRNKGLYSDNFSKIKLAMDLAVAEAEMTYRISPLEVGLGILVPVVSGFFLYNQSNMQGTVMMIAGVGATGLTVALNEFRRFRIKRARDYQERLLYN